jgi:hypothetical protein
MPSKYEPPEIERIGSVEDLTGGNNPDSEGDNVEPGVGTFNTPSN